MTLDFKTLQLSGKPNQYLMLPEGFESSATPDDRSPVFAVAGATLSAALKRVALAEARTEMLSADDDAGAYEFVQRSAVFRFPDFISVKIVPAGEGHSTLAIYSRAKVGYSDFGVNRKRVERWLTALKADLAAG